MSVLESKQWACCHGVRDCGNPVLTVEWPTKPEDDAFRYGVRLTYCRHHLSEMRARAIRDALDRLCANIANGEP
jgi:hypothetical protein